MSGEKADASRLAPIVRSSLPQVDHPQFPRMLEMSVIELFSGPLSLFSRKVEIALNEKGLPFDRIMVPFNQAVGYSPKHPEVLAANPKGQVPVLIDGDLKLYDSTVILEYIEDAYPEPPLYPGSPSDRARCRQLDLFADEVMLVPLRALMHRTEPRTDPHRWADAEAKVKPAEDLLRRQYSTLNDQLMGRDYFCNALSAGDIAVFMAVHFAQRLGGPSLAANEALRNWYSRLLLRPAFRTAAMEMREADLELSSPVDGAYPDCAASSEM
jgi:glutathione S-transferase